MCSFVATSNVNHLINSYLEIIIILKLGLRIIFDQILVDQSHRNDIFCCYKVYQQYCHYYENLIVLTFKTKIVAIFESILNQSI